MESVLRSGKSAPEKPLWPRKRTVSCRTISGTFGARPGKNTCPNVGGLCARARYRILKTLHIVEGPLDTDDYIGTKIHKNHPEIPSWPAKVGRQTEVWLKNETSCHGSSLSVYSGDSDFLSFFPLNNQVMIFHYLHTAPQVPFGDPNRAFLTLRNYKLARESMTLMEEMYTVANREYDVVKEENRQNNPWFTRDLLYCLSIRCIAMTLPNDYLTCTLHDRQSLAETLVQMRIWMNHFVPPVHLGFARSQFCFCFAVTFLYKVLERSPKYLENTETGQSTRSRSLQQQRKTYLTNCLRPFVVADATNAEAPVESPFHAVKGSFTLLVGKDDSKVSLLTLVFKTEYC